MMVALKLVTLVSYGVDFDIRKANQVAVIRCIIVSYCCVIQLPVLLFATPVVFATTWKRD